MTKVSIVIPAYNEGTVIAETLAAVDAIAAARPESFEYIVIDDGSSDTTWEVITRLPKTRHHLKALSFSRNYGKEAAIAAGLAEATGDAAIIMDGDLQHPPEVIPELLDKWQQTGSDIVHATKEGRENETVKTSLTVGVFYKVHHLLTGSSLTNASDFKLISKDVIDVYNQHRERALFFRGLIPTLGFKQEYVTFTITKRENGNSKWNSVSRAKLGLRAILAFSVVPLQIVTILGGLFFVGGTILAIEAVIKWRTGEALDGFTTVILLLLIIGAVIMVSLGIIGQYIAFIYEEVRNRPRYIVQKKLVRDQSYENSNR